MKYLFLFFFISAHVVNASENNDAILSSDNNLADYFDQASNERYHDQFVDFKESQNDLADSERTKKLIQNQYWLVNKNSNLWIGFFDGKRVMVPKGIYPDINSDSYLPEQIIRIKIGEKLSQFVIKSTGINSYGYPLHCYNKVDALLLDKPSYLLLYTGCTNITPRRDGRRDISYAILFYSKTFDTLVSINEFTSPELIDNKLYAAFLKSKEGFFIYEKTNIAFKINGKDKVDDVDPNTGLSLNRDDSSEDTDGSQVLPLERLSKIDNK